MRPLSLASTIVWLISGNETARSQRDKIDVEHVYLAICKCAGFRGHDTATVMAMLKAPPEQLSETQSQFEQIRAVFAKLAIDPNENRNKFRVHIGLGAVFPPPAYLHRTDACRSIFRVADVLSRENMSKDVTPLHLLWAIFKTGNNTPASFLADQGVDVNNILMFCLEILQKMDKREKQVSEGPIVSEFLDKLGRNLTREAHHGRLNPVIGMKNELFQLVQSLLRQDKNGVLLLGEPGVGKTCLVEGLAQLLISPQIPERIKHLRQMNIIELTPSSLTAGMKHMGDFERQMAEILVEAEKFKESLIVFIDEFHMIMGAGKTGQAMDAANILKPALSRGRINLIGATTIQEYVQYIEPDQAFDRRFVKVFVNEPSAEECVRIIDGLKGSVEHKYSICIPAKLIADLVDMSDRYLPSRRQPDKSIDLLHQAAARKLLGSTASSFWRGDGLLSQTSSPAVPRLDKQIIADVLADMTKIPADRIMQKVDDRLLNIRDELLRSIIGQEEAVETVFSFLKRAGLGLTDSHRPDGVFLFLGPTGVGKTALAKSLAKSLFGQVGDHLFHIDMSEYHDSHQISRLIGAPPGYIGYDKEGELTGFIRKNPYAIVVFDEVEKAHPDIFDLFLQLFDEGRLTDTHGRRADFSHTFIILTSNIGPSGVKEWPKLGIQLDEVMTGPSRKQVDKKDMQRHLALELRRYFRPEILNRIDRIVNFYPLGPQAIIAIARNMIADFSGRLRSEQNIELIIEDDIFQLIARKGYNEERGARELKRTIETMLIDPLVDHILHQRPPEQSEDSVFTMENRCGPRKLRLLVDKQGTIVIKGDNKD